MAIATVDVAGRAFCRMYIDVIVVCVDSATNCEMVCLVKTRLAPCTESLVAT